MHDWIAGHQGSPPGTECKLVSHNITMDCRDLADKPDFQWFSYETSALCCGCLLSIVCAAHVFFTYFRDKTLGHRPASLLIWRTVFSTLFCLGMLATQFVQFIEDSEACCGRHCHSAMWLPSNLRNRRVRKLTALPRR